MTQKHLSYHALLTNLERLSIYSLWLSMIAKSVIDQTPIDVEFKESKRNDNVSPFGVKVIDYSHINWSRFITPLVFDNISIGIKLLMSINKMDIVWIIWLTWLDGVYI
jgi:hypothetical protein